MKYLSLFSGIGGFEFGIQKAYENLRDNGKSETGTSDIPTTRDSTSSSVGLGDGWNEQPKCIGFSEIDKYAISIYERHFPNHKNYGDVTKINPQELPDFDFLVGGFPCQAFSIAGKRGGFADTRGTLFFDIARILKVKRPRLLLLENVKGLLSHDSGRTFKTIISTLAELGYSVEWQVLNAKDFGVPQNRERVFIIGYFGGLPGRTVFPLGENGGTDHGLPRHIANTITRRYEGAQATGTYIGEGELNAQEMKIRRLTPLECERLMAYPDGWTEGVSDTQRYKCLGNGVVSNVVQAIVERLL